MAYKIRKLRNKNIYQIRNTKTDEIHSKHETMDEAKKKVRYLNWLDKQIEIDQIKFPINPFQDLMNYKS
jgi:hypothetical protein